MAALCLFNVQAAVTQPLHPPEVDSVISLWLQQGLSFRTTDSLRSDLIIFFARKQLGIPYVANTLDRTPNEQLVVDLHGEDCVTFVENTLALARTALEHDNTSLRFCKNLRLLRYRYGKINGYASRLNYFSDWLLSNQKKGIISIPSQKWKASVPMGRLWFMSAHRNSYRQLRQSDSLLHLIRKQEIRLSSDGLRYLPKNHLSRYIDQIRSGDIIAFVTTIPGLDVSHTALALRSGDSVTFIHANPRHGVTVEPQGLLPYVLHRKTLKGVIIARLRNTSPDSSPVTLN